MTDSHTITIKFHKGILYIQEEERQSHSQKHREEEERQSHSQKKKNKKEYIFFRGLDKRRSDW